MKQTLILSLVAMWFECGPTLTPIQSREPNALVAASPDVEFAWAFDTSGSMLLPTDPLAPQCTSGCGTSVGNPCAGSCLTRLKLAKAGSSALLLDAPATASHRFLSFPKDAVCGAPDALSESSTADQVVALVQSKLAQGGTPTSAALRRVAQTPLPPGRERLVVLLTDGQPNCNPNNPNEICTAAPGDAERLATCRCTVSSCATSLCALGCADHLDTIVAAQELSDSGGQLMVVTLGDDFEQSAAPYSSVRVAMKPTCASDLDCQGRRCEDHECADRIFRVRSEGDFVAVRDRLRLALRTTQRCVYWLNSAVAAPELTVLVGDTALAADAYRLTSRGGQQRVELIGEACQNLLDNPQLTAGFARKVAD